MITRVKYWYPVCIFQILYAPYYINSDEKEIESLPGKTGQDIKWQIKWSGLSMTLLGRLRYTLVSNIGKVVLSRISLALEVPTHYVALILLFSI
jgi:hypothetical protein